MVTQGLFSALGSQATSVIKPAPVLPVGLAETVQVRLKCVLRTPSTMWLASSSTVLSLVGHNTCAPVACVCISAWFCAADVKAWSVPHVDVGSFVLNPTAFDLSDLYAALHPQNFS